MPPSPLPPILSPGGISNCSLILPFIFGVIGLLLAISLHCDIPDVFFPTPYTTFRIPARPNPLYPNPEIGMRCALPVVSIFAGPRQLLPPVRGTSSIMPPITAPTPPPPTIALTILLLFGIVSLLKQIGFCINFHE